MGSQRGQATVEWVGLVLLATIVLGGAAAVAGPNVDGRSFGGFITHRIVCGVRGGCDDGDSALARAYGRGDAELVRRYAPDMVYEPGERELPVDWTRCRRTACADAPDDRDLDAHRSNAGVRATVFTRVVRRNGRTYLQYWFYYPDSNSTFAGSDKIWRVGYRALRAMRVVHGRGVYPGFHRDDWEGYQLRIGRDGGVSVRATLHGGYTHCKYLSCRNRWGPATGWTRVSRGSHAGHIPFKGRLRMRGHLLLHVIGKRPRGQLPGRDLRERTSTSDGLRLIPLETVDQGRYRAHAKGISPPWRKRVYRDPESGAS